MKTVFGATLLFLAGTATASDELFQLLDTNGDNVVRADEISPAQRPFFLRALRVSDRNEDGALTRDELVAATTDPQRTQISTGQNRLRNAGSFDPARFDANKDGKVSQSEIPTALRSRLAPLFERFGTEEIAVADLKRVLSYTAGGQSNNQSPRRDSRSSDQKMSDQKMSDQRMSDRRMMEGRPDDQQTGRPSASRQGALLQQMRQRMQNFRGERGGSGANARNRAGAAGGASASASSADVFQRMDRNRDGRLSGNEIPERMKSALRRFDRNSDQALSAAEFKAMSDSYRRQRDN